MSGLCVCGFDRNAGEFSVNYPLHHRWQMTADRDFLQRSQMMSASCDIEIALMRVAVGEIIVGCQRNADGRLFSFIYMIRNYNSACM